MKCLFAFAADFSGSCNFSFVPFSFGDHFEWNKVTSCIHNILSGQRWIEHYGEIVIKNLNDDSCHCKVNFIKVASVPVSCGPRQALAELGLGAQAVLGNFSPSFLCQGPLIQALPLSAGPGSQSLPASFLPLLLYGLSPVSQPEGPRQNISHHDTVWMSLEDIMLSEISQTQKGKNDSI